MLTIRQAAKQAGVSKAALSRAIKSGKISANKNAIDGWDVDPADLFRANPVSAGTAILMARIDVEIDWLGAQMEQVKKMRKQLDNMKVQSEKWQDQAQSAQRLSTDIRPQRRSWFGFEKASASF